MGDIWILLLSSIIAISCSLIGLILVLKRMAMLSDAISHSVLPGIVISYLIIGEMDYSFFTLAAIATAIVSTLLIEGVSRLANYRKDISMGIVYTLLFSIGVILLTKHQDTVPIQSDHVIQGNLEMVPLEPMWIINDAYLLGPYSMWNGIINLVLVALFVGIFAKQIKIWCFDSGYASSLGMNTKLLSLILMVLTSFTVVSSFSSIGAILVIGFIVIPPSTAIIVSNTFKSAIWISCSISVVSCVLGLYAAKFFDVSIAGMICLVMSLIFMAVFVFTKYSRLARS